MKLFKRSLSLFLAIALFSVSLSNAHASMVSNNQIINSINHTSDKANLLQTIKRTDVQEQLASLGVNPADIESRINQMTHEEIAQLNQQMTELPAGGGVLGTLTLIFIVFVITDVIGATDIFPFIHPVNK